MSRQVEAQWPRGARSSALPAPTPFCRLPRQIIGAARTRSHRQHFHDGEQQCIHTKLPRAELTRHDEYEKQPHQSAPKLRAGEENGMRDRWRDTHLAGLRLSR
jgi:hypothetical protein